MDRSTIDRLISWTGAVLAGMLLAASAVLFYAYNFVHGEVHDQLSAQRITIPAEDSKSFTALSAVDQEAIRPYAGQQLVTGVQAKVYSDNYINAHLAKIGGGKTYSELSTESMANPSDAALAAKVQTMFRGETLRGLLLNAYAFDTMAVIAMYAAWGCLVAVGLLVVCVALGFRHSKKASKTKRRSRK